VITAQRSTSRRSRALTVAAALLGTALSTGCYTTTHVVSVAPLKTKYPVSASGQFLDEQGAVVTEDNYKVVAPFEFDQRIEAPRHETTETQLKLEANLDRILAENRGDAMTDVSIVATDYDPGSHGSAAGWKILGWTFGLSGATCMAVGAGTEDAGPLVAVGGVFLGVGVLGFALSALADDPAAWTVEVKGNVVSRQHLGGLGLSGGAEAAPGAPTTPRAPAVPTPAVPTTPAGPTPAVPTPAVPTPAGPGATPAGPGATPPATKP
jgi:hypothetical protein